MEGQLRYPKKKFLVKKIKLGDLYFLSFAFTEAGNDCNYTKAMFYLKDVQ